MPDIEVELNGHEDPFAPYSDIEEGDDWLNSTEHDDDEIPEQKDTE